MSEHEIERFLDRACCGVGGSPELRRHLRNELKEHLDEEIEQDIAAGMTREEAEAKALEEFGDPLVIRDGMQSVHGRRLMSLLIEKSMIWRERTMKTGWKWRFVTHLVLILTIAAEVLLAAGALMYVVPILKVWHEEMDLPMFKCIDTIIRIMRPLVYGSLWIPCLLVLLVAWGLLEWKCRGEHKTAVRLGILSLASLGMFFVMAAVCIPVTLDSTTLILKIHRMHRDMTPEKAERVVVPRIVESEGAFEELRGAIAEEDWWMVGRWAGDLGDALASLHGTNSPTFALAGENRDNLDDIRRLALEGYEACDAIRDRCEIYERSKTKTQDAPSMKVKVQTYFQQLERLYAELKEKSDLFAAYANPRESSVEVMSTGGGVSEHPDGGQSTAGEER